nr:acyltransferase domain-containing protein [Flexivirga meconopsidis]
MPSSDEIRARITGAARVRAFAYFAVEPADTADFAAAADSIAADRALLGEVAEVVAQLREGMGVPLTQTPARLPARFDPHDPDAPLTDRFFYPVAFVGALADALAYHRSRAIPDAASRAIFADLGRHLRIFERTFGQTGLHVQDWFALHLRGLIYDFGRLQGNLTELTGPAADLAAAAVPAPPGAMVIDTHIPDIGPLTPAEVDASFGRMSPFFARHFPELPPLRIAVCTSWLLDEQLQTLVPGSNIAAFGARWHPIGPPSDGDWSVRNFVFRRPDAPLDRLTGSSRLEQAVLKHWRSGAHLQVRTGWCETAHPQRDSIDFGILSTMSNEPTDDTYDIEEEETATDEGMPLRPGYDDANRPEPAESSSDD